MERRTVYKTNVILLTLGNYGMQMNMDELKIWYRELSAQEVLNEAIGQVSSKCSINYILLACKDCACETRNNNPHAAGKTFSLQYYRRIPWSFQ